MASLEEEASSAEEDVVAAFTEHQLDTVAVGVDDENAQRKWPNGGWLRADVVVMATGYERGAKRFPFVEQMFSSPPRNEFDDNDEDDDDQYDWRWHLHDRGVCTHVPGLFMIGLPWQQRADSSLIHGLAAGVFCHVVVAIRCSSRADAKHVAWCVRRVHVEAHNQSTPAQHNAYRELSELK